MSAADICAVAALLGVSSRPKRAARSSPPRWPARPAGRRRAGLVPHGSRRARLPRKRRGGRHGRRSLRDLDCGAERRRRVRATGSTAVDIDATNFGPYLGPYGGPTAPLGASATAFDADAPSSMRSTASAAACSVSRVRPCSPTAHHGPDRGRRAARAKIVEGLAFLNGKWIDGNDNPPSGNYELSLDDFEAVFVHEFGHFAGLDHTQAHPPMPPNRTPRRDPAGRDDVPLPLRRQPEDPRARRHGGAVRALPEPLSRARLGRSSAACSPRAAGRSRGRTSSRVTSTTRATPYRTSRARPSRLGERTPCRADPRRQLPCRGPGGRQRLAAAAAWGRSRHRSRCRTTRGLQRTGRERRPRRRRPEPRDAHRRGRRRHGERDRHRAQLSGFRGRNVLAKGEPAAELRARGLRRTRSPTSSRRSRGSCPGT